MAEIYAASTVDFPDNPENQDESKEIDCTDMTAVILPTLDVANQPLFMSASFSFETANTRREEEKISHGIFNVENKSSPFVLNKTVWQLFQKLPFFANVNLLQM